MPDTRFNRAVYLKVTEEVDEQITRAAKLQGVSVAALVREYIRRGLIADKQVQP